MGMENLESRLLLSVGLRHHVFTIPGTPGYDVIIVQRMYPQS
jgi:hypothetical protein